jgi:hypothetical protein
VEALATSRTSPCASGFRVEVVFMSVPAIIGCTMVSGHPPPTCTASHSSSSSQPLHTTVRSRCDSIHPTPPAPSLSRAPFLPLSRGRPIREHLVDSAESGAVGTTHAAHATAESGRNSSQTVTVFCNPRASPGTFCALSGPNPMVHRRRPFF